MNQKDIAVRMFTNDTYGKSYAKGKFKKAIFNATAELRNPSLKYLLDFYRYKDWVNVARTDEDMLAVEELADPVFMNNPDIMLSWVQYYDPLTKQKLRVAGVGVLDLARGTLKLLVDDLTHDVSELWNLDVATCKASGPGKPALLAANIDVGDW